MDNKNKFEMKVIVIFFSFVALIAAFLLVSFQDMKQYIDTDVEVYQYSNNKDEDVLFLSNIDYVKSQSFTRYDKIRYDEINGGGKITLKIEGNAFSFDKGIWAHASSRVTYDISEYNYKYFTVFIGINTTSNRGDGVKFLISTSEDGNNWEVKHEEEKLPGKEATHVVIELENAKYIRLEADQLSNNANDHSVYADAKLVNDIKSTSIFKMPEEYDEIIKNLYSNQTDLVGELEFNVLKRQLVSNVGNFTINSFYNSSEDNKAVLDWLMNDQRALKNYILGGKPTGSYYNSLNELSRLYRNYKTDFNNQEVTKYGTVLGDLYLRMAISLSLTHSYRVGLWINNAANSYNQSDSVRRYAIFKYMHKTGLLKGVNGADIGEWFEDYTIEEMRFVMANSIDDESILWLNAYTQELIDKYGYRYITPHPYIAYVTPNDNNPVFYAEENKDYFNDLFSVINPNDSENRIGLWDLEYTIPGGVDSPEYTLKIPRGTLDNIIYKLWIVMRNKFGTGVVCGGISKTGANIKGVHGIPAVVVGQPGHAAYVHYSRNTNGEGYWALDNDVSGWAYTGSAAVGSAIYGVGRGLLGWSSAPFATGDTGTYLPLAQEVLNHKDTFEQSAKFVYLANSYGDLAQKEDIYRKALAIQPLNIDAWYGLIETYNTSSSKSEEDYYELAKEIAENLKYYPLPMYQLTNLIKPKLTSIGASYKFTLLQTRILTEASVIPNNSTAVLQPSITKLMSNFLLGKVDSTIASFSFDGEDAGKIVLSSRFDGNGIRWDYSISGTDPSNFKEVSFTDIEEHKWQLTEEELASITSENDIYIHIVGVNYDEENLYKIDIQESAGLPSTLFASDLENKLLGAVGVMEWKYNEDDEWTRYETTEPDLTGDKEVFVKMGATGTHLASNTSSKFTFTEDIVNEKRKYIPISHLSLESVSTEATNNGGSASFALDGNYNTRWHSAWNGTDNQRFITVKFDQPYNISAVEFVPAGGGNGKIYDGTIWGSMDGENWIVLKNQKGITYSNNADSLEQAMANIKSFDIDIPQRVQYIKIVADRTNGNWVAARAFNFYQDTTIKIVANFSFDEEENAKLELVDSQYDNDWKYSLDGGTTWNKASSHSYNLTKEQIAQLSVENGIKIKLGNSETVYSVQLKEADELKLNPYVNDLENRLIGLQDISTLEWKFKDSDTWTSYAKQEPVVIGNRVLQVRKKAFGIMLPSNILEFEFTEDNQPDTMRYIPVKNLSIHDYISQSKDSKRPYYAPNVIDANPNTQWHSDFAVSVAGKEAFITLKINTPRYISGLDYAHLDASLESYGFMKNGQVFVSEDGENWQEVAKFENVDKDDSLKHISFKESVYGQYVKLVIESYDNIFVAASLINLYEDVTKKVTADVNVVYDITTSTNQNVTASIESDANITVTNNSGSKEYIFEENGTFTFEYTDEFGESKTIDAVVNWIDKIPPVGTISYSTHDVTNENVVVTLNTNEPVTITNNKGSNKYTFTENGTFTFEFVDKAGNKGTSTADVTWINKQAPTAKITYNITSPTNQNVTATIEVANGIEVINNNGSKEYIFTENGTFIFEFVDKAGNRGTATAKVDWIDKTPPKGTISYSIKDFTNQNVIATLITNEEIIITNNNGSKEYEFKENGEFTFEFVDKAGNKGSSVAKVEWIDKIAPTAEVKYNITDPTVQDVIATLFNESEEITITNNNGSKEYTFVQNGSFTFEFVDKAGNKGSVTATVNNIKQSNVIPTITYSTTNLTNQNVVATVTFSEENITIINNDGSNEKVFEENGEFNFVYIDSQGNKGVVTAKVDWIDKIDPTAEVKYSTTDFTNQNVIVTLIQDNEEIIIINNNGSKEYIFEENGEFTFEFMDKAGNKGKVIARVDWIDKIAPTANIKYSNLQLTNQDVVVSLTDMSEEIQIINNDGKDTYTFSENGEFIFEFVDKAGNKGNIKAVVNWIDKIAPIGTIHYSITGLTNQDVTATIQFNEENVIILNGGPTHIFTENGEFTFEFKDMAGNIGTLKATVNWINKENDSNSEIIIPPSKPAEDNNTYPSDNDNTIDLPSNDEESQEKNIYYYLDGIKVILAKDNNIKDIKLKKAEFLLPKKFQDLVSVHNDCFELYFQNDSNERVTPKVEKVLLTIDSINDSLKIFEIKNNTLHELEYKRVSQNEIEISGENTGRYVISYGNKEIIEENQKDVKSESDSILLYVLVASIVLLGLSSVVLYRKRK